MFPVKMFPVTKSMVEEVLTAADATERQRLAEDEILNELRLFSINFKLR